MIALIFGFLVPIGHSFKHYMVRKYAKTYDTLNLEIDSGVFESATNFGIAIYWIYIRGFEGITWQ